jgi:hypothetical protein
MQHASSSIIMSVAALEANANEILKDLRKNTTTMQRPLGDTECKHSGKLSKDGLNP